MMTLQSQLLHGGSVADFLPGADCRSVLRCHHSCHGSEQYSVCLLRMSYSSVRHFRDLSWIVDDLPCFSEVRAFTSWYALLLLLSFSKFQSPRTVHLSSPLLLSLLLLNPLVGFPVFVCSFLFKPLLLQISPLLTGVENISSDPRFFLVTFHPKYLTCSSVSAVL